MKIFYKLLLGLFIMPAMVILLTAQEKYQSIIKGRVVDEQLQPVENANIRFDNSAQLKGQKCWVKNNSVSSGKNGTFLHEEYCSLPNRAILLYIVPRLGFDTIIAPIYPPFWNKLRLSNQNFAGLSVIIEGNKEIDVGNVPIQVWYNRLELYVLNKKGKSYYKTEDNWSKFKLIVRNENGDDVGSDALSIFDIENKVDMEKGFVKMALPEGTWTLELLADWDDYNNKTGKTMRNLAKTIVTIKKSESTLPARLVVK